MSFKSFSNSFILLLVICGINGGPPVRIIGGAKARIGEFKYQISIWENDKYICGGCILTKFYILTAGHCVYLSKLSKIRILAGVSRFDQKDIIYRDVERIRIHPMFEYGGNDCFSMKNDIAILRLDEPLPKSHNLEELKLPSSTVNNGEIGFLAGWGYTSIDGDFSVDLRKTTLKILSKEKCRDLGMTHRRNEFCAIHPKKYASVSEGDSGSPLMIDDTVVGILSVSATNCAADRPAIFTNVFSHMGFISQAMTI